MPDRMPPFSPQKQLEKLRQRHEQRLQRDAVRRQLFLRPTPFSEQLLRAARRHQRVDRVFMAVGGILALTSLQLSWPAARAVGPQMLETVLLLIDWEWSRTLVRGTPIQLSPYLLVMPLLILRYLIHLGLYRRLR